MRLMLKPALVRLWRDPTTVQLGIDPQRAVLLRAADLTDLDLLDLLDGTRDEPEIRAEAERRGHDLRFVADVLERLRAAGALEDESASHAPAGLEPDLQALSLVHPAPGAARSVMQRRRAATVAVYGAGRVGSSVAALLAAAGVGSLVAVDHEPLRHVDLSPGGLRGLPRAGTTRGVAVRALTSSLSRSAPQRPGSADVVVLAPAGPVIPPEWLHEVGNRPHLRVVIRETAALIGPFVLPGRSPCLRCVELQRADRDGAWLALSAQLLGKPRPVEPCDTALAGFAASTAALHVLAHLDGHPQPPTLGGICELRLEDLRLRRRTVTAHPSCRCGAGSS